MKVLEFHADDLIDREIRGILSPDERRRLEEHLDRCVACRMERQLRADFNAELAPGAEQPSLQSFVSGALRQASASVTPKTQIDPAALIDPTAMVEAVLQAQKIVAERNDAAVKNVDSVRPITKSPTWKKRFVLLAAAATVFATGIAAADTGLARRALEFVRVDLAGALVGSSGPEAQPAKSAKHSAKAVALYVEALSVPDPQASANPMVSALPVEAAMPIPPVSMVPQMQIATTTTQPVFTSVPTSVVRHAPVVEMKTTTEPAAHTDSVAPSMKPDATIETASTLFDRATAARRDRGAADASVLYRELQTRFPNSPEARLSIATVARMQLDRGDSASALSGFDSYLATGDRALREEAMQGRASALHKLGRQSEAKNAWSALLRAYPNSAYKRVAEDHAGGDIP